MPDHAVIEIEQLRIQYGLTPILEGVSLSVRQGEVMALIGPNGAGKTTLIRGVSGVLKPASGQIRILGKDLARLTPAQRASHLAVVPQARNLPEGFTVGQTVLMGRTPYLGWLGQPGDKDRERVHWALQRTDTLELAERYLGELSGGEQQRVLLARALAQDTPALLLDEPTAHLDVRHQSTILNLVRELASEQGLAVLMALHDLNLVALYAESVALLSEGKISIQGDPAEVLTPANLMAAYQVDLHIITHPEYGTPLILPDGRHKAKKR
jgi:iron complex transport system ATP-binding protein